MTHSVLGSGISRRGFFGKTAAALAAPAALQTLCSCAVAEQQPPEGAAQLTHYQEAEIGGKVRGPHLWLRWDNETLLSYRAHTTQKYPYFYPLIGPASGLPVTSESALPWPHHRSLYFSVDKLNKANYWQEGLERGQAKSQGPKVSDATPTSAVIQDECVWAVQDGPVQMTDKRTYAISVEWPRLWSIDARIVWTAVENVAIEKTNHGLFSLRCAPDLSTWGGGTLLSSNGDVGEQATFGKPASWCAFFGKRRKGTGPMEGIALFDHPENPWHPCPWFTRDYGFISPMPFQWLEKPWELAAGQSVTLKYKAVVFAGTPQEVELDKMHAAWVAG